LKTKALSLQEVVSKIIFLSTGLLFAKGAMHPFFLPKVNLRQVADGRHLMKIIQMQLSTFPIRMDNEQKSNAPIVVDI